MAKTKRTNNDVQNMHIKLRSSNTNTTKKRGVNPSASGRVSSSCSTVHIILAV